MMNYCPLAECKNMSLWEMLSWRSPKVTGCLLAIVLSVIVVCFFMQYTFVLLACRLLQLCLIAGAVFTFVMKRSFTSDDIECAVNKFVESATPVVMRAVKTTHDIVMWRDVSRSAVVAAASFVVGFIGGYVSDGWFAIVFTALAFGFPVVYDQKKDVIDHWVKVGMAQVDKCLGMVKTKMADNTKKRS